jgi:hypothetical protein
MELQFEAGNDLLCVEPVEHNRTWAALAASHPPPIDFSRLGDFRQHDWLMLLTLLDHDLTRAAVIWITSP